MIESSPNDSTPPSVRRLIVGYMITIAILALAARYALKNWESVRQVAMGSPEWIAAVALIVIGNIAAQAVLLRALVRGTDYSVSGWDCLLVTAASTMFGMLTLPAAGTAYRAACMRAQYRVPVPVFAAGTLLFLLIRVFVWSTIGISGVVLIGIRGNGEQIPFIIAILVCITALMSTGMTSAALRRISRSRESRLQRLAQGCCEVAVSKRVFATAIIVTLGCSITQIAGFWFAFSSFNLPLNPVSSTTIVAFHQLSGNVGITPGGIGIQEASAVFVTESLGIAVPRILIVLALIRTCRLGIAILVGVPCWWALSRSRDSMQVFEKSRAFIICEESKLK